MTVSETVCSRPLEGCWSCEEHGLLPSNGCHGAWVKATLCWSVAGEASESISHYLVWTCAPVDRVRTLSAADHSNRASITDQSDTAAADDGRGVSNAADAESRAALPSSSSDDDDDDERGDDKLLCAVTSRLKIARPNSANSAQPQTDVIDQDQSGTEASRWRCLGLSPVTSFSLEHEHLAPNCQQNFRVQPILFTGAALPRVNVDVRT